MSERIEREAYDAHKRDPDFMRWLVLGRLRTGRVIRGRSFGRDILEMKRRAGDE